MRRANKTMKPQFKNKGRAPSANSVRIMASRASQLAVEVLIDTIQDKASNQTDRVNAALAILKIGVMPVHKAPYKHQDNEKSNEDESILESE